MQIKSLEQINRLLLFQEEDFQALHQSIKNENLVIFIGAGVSKLYDCFLWSEMASKLVEELRKAELISYADESILFKEAITEPRKIISICYKICKNSMQVYENVIKEATDISRNPPKIQEIYKRIFSIKAMTYLTTNIDLGINRYIEYTGLVQKLSIYDCTSPQDQERIEQNNFNIFKDSNIIYLHGTCQNIQESILPVEKYLQFYNEKNNFLNGLFLEMKRSGGVIIFIGYTLNEWDIVERIYKMKEYPKEKVAYLLSPIFSYEIAKFNLETIYYNSFGVESIPYIIDDEGYEKLYFVLDNLIKAIDKNIPSPYKIIQEIEQA